MTLEEIWVRKPDFLYVPVVYSFVSEYDRWRKYIYSNSFLVSGYTLMNNKYPVDFFHDIKKNGYMIGDSGGFQKFSLGVNINPKKLMKILQKYCNIGFILDTPPNIKLNDNMPAMRLQFDKKNFDLYLQETIDMTKKMLELYDESNFILGGVIHGVGYDTMRRWYDAVKELYDFKFWGVAPKPSDDIFLVIKTLKYVDKFGIKDVHFLAFSGMRFLLFARYFQNKLKDIRISFDSTAPFGKASIRQYYVFKDFNIITFDWKRISYKDTNLVDIFNKIKRYVEKGTLLYKFWQDILNDQFKLEKESDISNVLYFNNLYALQDFIKMIVQMSQEDLRDIIKVKYRNMNLNTLESIFDKDDISLYNRRVVRREL